MNKKVFLLIGALLSTAAFAEKEKCPTDLSVAVENHGWKLDTSVLGDTNNINYAIQTTTLQYKNKQPAKGKMGLARAAKALITCKYSYQKPNDNRIYSTEIEKTFNGFINFENGKDWESLSPENNNVMECSGAECYFTVEPMLTR
ncbi:MAG: hypothetical protein K0R94_1035 [Burkholderiales bacterium]|jgi:hypothetical protein|nr:hypothetical protein [Burkholderiales bacterium]